MFIGVKTIEIQQVEVSETSKKRFDQVFEEGASVGTGSLESYVTRNCRMLSILLLLHGKKY